MTTAWDKLAKKGRQRSRRFLSEQVDGLRRNLADIVLGQAETRVDHLQPACRRTADDTVSLSKGNRETSLFNLEQNHSRRIYNSLRHCDSKEPYFSKERAEKQHGNVLNSAGKDPTTPANPADSRKGRVKSRTRRQPHRQPDGGEVRWQTRDHLRGHAALNRHKRSSYPPLVADNGNSEPAPLIGWSVDDDKKLRHLLTSSSSKDAKKDHTEIQRQPCKMSQDRVEHSTRTKPGSSNKTAKRDFCMSSSNGERKGSYERTRSYSTGGRMTSKQTIKKHNDVTVRKPPKAPSWQSLLSPTPASPTPLVDKKKHSQKTESLPGVNIQVRPEESFNGPRPPKPPSWQTLTVPAQPAMKRQSSSPASSHHDLSRSSQPNHSEETVLDHSSEQDHTVEELDSVTSESSAQSESADQPRQRKINIKRTRSRFIDSTEVPKQQTVVRLSQAKPLEYHLRETEFDNLIYLRENEERCKRWLQSLECNFKKNGQSKMMEDKRAGQLISNHEDFFAGSKFNFIASPYPPSVSSQETL